MSSDALTIPSPVAPNAPAPDAHAATPELASPEPTPTDADTPAAEPAAEPAAPQAPTLSPEACAQELKQRFPALFRGSPKPVKLRIQADIQQRAPGLFSKTMLSTFLRRHTGSTSYLMALTTATQRFDLDGQPAGELSDEHRQAAIQELARRRATQNARREQDLQERQNRATLLRDFENNRLTTANFCALKGVEPEALDGLLAQARAEAAEAPPRAEMPRRELRGPGRRPDRPDPSQQRPGARPPRGPKR